MDEVLIGRAISFLTVLPVKDDLQGFQDMLVGGRELIGLDHGRQFLRLLRQVASVQSKQIERRAFRIGARLAQAILPIGSPTDRVV